MMKGTTRSTFHREGEAQFSLHKFTEVEKKGLDPKPVKWVCAFSPKWESSPKDTLQWSQLVLSLSAADTLGLALQTENFDTRIIIDK